VLEKVFYTSVLISDQDKALDFYTNVVGLEKRVENPTPDGPRFLTVGVKGTTTSWSSGPGHRARLGRRWDAPLAAFDAATAVSGPQDARERRRAPVDATKPVVEQASRGVHCCHA
jgi:catechol 2,3-dioxygenase-like lactoylglutathione lyase family enzyme